MQGGTKILFFLGILVFLISPIFGSIVKANDAPSFGPCVLSPTNPTQSNSVIYGDYNDSSLINIPVDKNNPNGSVQAYLEQNIVHYPDPNKLDIEQPIQSLDLKPDSTGTVIFNFGKLSPGNYDVHMDAGEAGGGNTFCQLASFTVSADPVSGGGQLQ